MEFSPQLASGARRLRIATGIGLAAVIALTLAGGAAALLGVDGVRFGADVPDSPAAEIAAALLSGLPFCLGLWRLMAMLRRIEQGAVFEAETIAEMRGFAGWVLVSALASILAPPLLTAAWALAEGPQSLKLSMTFDGSDFFVLLIAALLFFIARLFGEAQRIADENRQIV